MKSAAAVCLGLLLPAAVAIGEEVSVPWLPLPEGQVCATTERYYANYGPPQVTQRGGCPLDGPCDDPALRDLYLTSEDMPVRTVRTQVVVFCRTNGQQCLSNDEEIAGQMQTLNETFAPYRIKFEYEVSYARQTAYRTYNPQDEIPLKNQFAVDPQRRLNIFVVDTTGFAFGTFPWDQAALTNQGGIIMDADLFGPGQTILTHEVGHCLGLWHTHHGVSEVPNCSECYEVPFDESGDNTGDRCADTPPTPVNFNCQRPGGRDSCSELRWRETDFENYMGYAPQECYTRLSPQQAARCHCWLDDVLWTWVMPVCGEDVNADRVVDLSDLTLVLANFGEEKPGPYDIDQDGRVGLGDLAKVLSSFGRDCN